MKEKQSYSGGFMKLKASFITHDVGNSQMMVDTSAAKSHFNGIVRSNSTAAFIINALKTETTREELIAKMLAEYDVDEERAGAAVDKVIETLKSIDALEA